VVSNLSRALIVIWCFVVLILTQSYTASLASLLTVEQLQPTVTDVRELIKKGEYVGYQKGSFVLGLLLDLGFDKSKLMVYSSAEECHAPSFLQRKSKWWYCCSFRRTGIYKAHSVKILL